MARLLGSFTVSVFGAAAGAVGAAGAATFLADFMSRARETAAHAAATTTACAPTPTNLQITNQVLQGVVNDKTFQCMRNPYWDDKQEREFKGLEQFWLARPELVELSKAILKKYLAALYVRYPFAYAYQSTWQRNPIHVCDFGDKLLFCTKELLFAKEQGLLDEDTIKHYMCSSEQPEKLWHWLEGELHKQLETVFPGFEYPRIVFESITYDHAQWIPLDVLNKDPCPIRRMKLVVEHIRCKHRNDEKFYTDFLYAHPAVLASYRQAAAEYLVQHPDTTDLPFFVLWYLKNKKDCM